MGGPGSQPASQPESQVRGAAQSFSFIQFQPPKRASGVSKTAVSSLRALGGSGAADPGTMRGGGGGGGANDNRQGGPTEIQDERKNGSEGRRGGEGGVCALYK